MTLSNFDWTDKTSVKWFIMLPTGHEGPYSLMDLLKKSEAGKLSLDAKIWSEGLFEAISIKGVLQKSEITPEKPAEEEVELPPIPEDAIPPLPIEEEDVPEVKPKKNRSYFPLLVILIIGIFLFGFYQWLKGQEEFTVRRQSKMSLELQGKIQKDFGFEGWDKKIFFKEYVPVDLSHIWLVTSGFQRCEVEASFQSIKDKLISLDDGQISFKTRGKLQNHLVEFSNFDFTSGTKVVPGMYEMSVKASECEWDGFAPAVGNYFRAPESTYMANMKVILFSKGPEEFRTQLDKLIRAKMEIEIKNQNQEELFWQGLQEKFQTLLAVTLNIEQHWLDLLAMDARKFNGNLPPAVDVYSRKFGQFLTSFVVANEKEFQQLAVSEVKDISQKRNYELMVGMTAKKIGLESMKIIEELQRLKNPRRIQLVPIEARIKEIYKVLKEDINQKIIQISEDRSL